MCITMLPHGLVWSSLGGRPLAAIFSEFYGWRFEWHLGDGNQWRVVALWGGELLPPLAKESQTVFIFIFNEYIIY